MGISPQDLPMTSKYRPEVPSLTQGEEPTSAPKPKGRQREDLMGLGLRSGRTVNPRGLRFLFLILIYVKNQNRDINKTWLPREPKTMRTDGANEHEDLHRSSDELS